MPIKYIFNGYFRSGTTMLWEILKTSNPNYTVFYEPLHPNLKDRIIKYKKHLNADNIHKKHLWSDYIKQNHSWLEGIFNNNKGKVLLLDKEKLFHYLDLYNKLPENVILQCNRMHFSLDLIEDQYNAAVFHIIRNPLAVYNSLSKTYNNSRKKLRSLLKNFFYHLIMGYDMRSKFWSIDFYIDYSCNKYNFPHYWVDPSKRRKILSDPLKTLVLSWVICNYHAINKIYNPEYILVYERFIKEKFLIKDRIEKLAAIQFDVKKVENRRVNLKDYRNKEILEIVDLLELNKEYFYLINRLNL